jgi:GMP synthase-like glutamine amidotransferase
MKPVLLIRNDPDDNLGISAACLRDAGAEVMQLDGFDRNASWPALEEIGGLAIFGGAMNVDETGEHPYLLRERRLMRDALSAQIPVLGICLGAQMLARSLGAAVRRAPVRELGFRPVSVTEAGRTDSLLAAFDGSRSVFQWHEDTFDLPEGTELLAEGQDVRNQAFRFGKSAWGVQFHFEVDEAGVEEWLRVAGPRLERVWKRTAAEVRRELAESLPDQQGRGREAFRAFAAQVRAQRISSLA